MIEILPYQRDNSGVTVDTYRWQDDAACAFADPGIFEGDSPLYSRSLAASYCDRCPVFVDCKTEAGDDVRHVYRAGVGPDPLKINTPKPPRRTVKPSKPRMKSDTCKRGHVGHYSEGKNRQCLACKRLIDMAVRRSKGVTARKKSDTCKRGHSEWTINFKTGKRNCAICGRAAAAASYARKKLAKMGA